MPSVPVTMSLEKEPLVDSTWNRAPARPLVGLVVSVFLTTSVYCSFVTVRLPIITLCTVLAGCAAEPAPVKEYSFTSQSPQTSCLPRSKIYFARSRNVAPSQVWSMLV